MALRRSFENWNHNVKTQLEDYEIKLIVGFPQFFDRTKEGTVFGPWGFQIAQGWYDIVREMVQAVEKQAVLEIRTKDNWPYCVQIKEKFGLLRVYVGNTNDEMQAIIHSYENKSRFICLLCGKPSKFHHDDWMRSLCDPCEERYQNSQTEDLD